MISSPIVLEIAIPTLSLSLCSDLRLPCPSIPSDLLDLVVILQFFARRCLKDQRAITRRARLECSSVDRQMVETRRVTYANVFRIDRPIHLRDDVLDTCDVTNTSQAFRLNFENIDTTVFR